MFELPELITLSGQINEIHPGECHPGRQPG